MSQIWIDDRLILTNDRLNDFRETRVRLTAGRHPIRIRYQDMHGASHIYLSWAPPGEPLQPIAGKFLYPAEPAEIR